MVVQIVSMLKGIKHQLWFDRHDIPLFADWAQRISEARLQTNFALVILSKNYTTTVHCLEELLNLQRNHNHILAIIIDDVELARIHELTQFTDMIDIQHLDYDTAKARLLSFLSSNMDSDLEIRLPSERIDYIHDLIDKLEIRLQERITSQSLHKRLDDGNDSIQIRPRGYLPNLLQQGAYTLSIDDEVLALENLVSLIEIQSNIVLQGVSGSGKSSIALLVGLWAAHKYRFDDDGVLPIYLNLADWEKFQSFEAFMSEQWQLAYDWQAWLLKHAAFFIIDVDETTIKTHPDYLEHILAYCIAPEEHSCLLITPILKDPIDTEYSIAMVTTQTLTDTLVDAFADSYLPQAQARQVKVLYETIESGRYERHIDYMSFLIEFLSTRSEAALETLPRHLVREIIRSRWDELFHEVDLPISYDELLAALSYLAWSMLASDNPYDMLYSEALNRIGDSALIELGIDLRLLQCTNDYLRFESRLLQNHLAAYLLVTDGVYKYLQKPIFDSRGQRQTSKWDFVVLAVYGIIDAEQHDEFIELIDDIDPFLAVAFARQNKVLLNQYLCQLISKLIDVRRKTPSSHRALVQTLVELSPVNRVALCLVNLMTEANWHIHEMLYDLLRQLPFAMPEHIIQQVHDLERDFPDSRKELLSNYSLAQWLVYLSYLVHHADPSIQRNAIALLGDCQHMASLPALFSLLESQSNSIIHDTSHAITNVINSGSSLSRLLMKLPDKHFDIDTISHIFIQDGRTVSAALMTVLDKSDSAFNREFCLALNQVSESVVRDIAMWQLSAMGYASEVSLNNEFEGDNAMKLSDLLQRRLQQSQDKPTLDKLFADITEGLKSLTQSSESDASSSELVQRTKIALKKRENSTETEAEVSLIPTELLDRLQYDDWLTRYRALQELTGYPAQEIQQYVADAAINDEDVQVRIVSLGILASLSDSEDTHQILVDALQDEDHLVIDAVTDIIKILDNFDSSRVIPLLVHPNLQTMAAAAEILSEHHNEDAIPALTDLLDDERTSWLDEKTIAFFAAKALRSMATPQAMDALKQSKFNLEPESNDVIPPAIEHSHRKSYTPEQKVLLTLTAMRGDNWDLAQKAARYLRELAKRMQGISNPTIITALEDALTDDIWTVRWAAVEALAWINSPTSIPKITILLHDSNWMIQVAAIRSLIELKATDSASTISELLNNPNTAVSEAAAEALGLLKNPVAIEALKQALTSEDEFVRLSAIKSIHHILGDEAIPYLLQMLNDPYNHIRWFAIKQLSTISKLNELTTIAKLLPDTSGPAWEEDTISDYAIKTLKNINTPASQLIIDEWVAESQRD